MKEEAYYLVYKIYKEHQRAVLHAWTTSKRILKAFLKQRDGKKYKVRLIDYDEMLEEFSVMGPPPGKMIDCLKLKSNQFQGDFCLFMTADEKAEAEANIFLKFREMSSISNWEGVHPDEIQYYVDFMCALKDEYFDALHYLGFAPDEVTILYDQVSDAMRFGDFHDDVFWDQVLATEDTIITKIIYSLESFIDVMKDDM